MAYLGTVALILAVFYLQRLSLTGFYILLQFIFDFRQEIFMLLERRQQNHFKHFYKMKEKILKQFWDP